MQSSKPLQAFLEGCLLIELISSLRQVRLDISAANCLLGANADNPELLSNPELLT